jgi:hypothetical protein
MSVIWKRFKTLKSIRSNLKHFGKICIIASYICGAFAPQAHAQLEDVLTSTVENQDFPTWLKSSYFFTKHKQLLESSFVKKDKNLKADETALKILNNYQANISTLSKIELPFRLFIFDAKGSSSKIDAVLRRQYFAQSDQKYSQQFREALEIKKPESLSNYRWVTFRFFDENPDRVWIKSAMLKKSRPVSWYLRSEPLFYSAIIANDILGLSDKLSDFETVIEPNLVTIPAAISGLDSLAPPVDSLSSEGMIPSFTVSVRQAVSAQLTSKDPFAKVGQIKILIDRATGVPLYKAILNRKGDVISLLVQALPLDATKEGSEQNISTLPTLARWGFKEIFRPKSPDNKEPVSAKATIMYGAPIINDKIDWDEESFDPNL